MSDRVPLERKTSLTNNVLTAEIDISSATTTSVVAAVTGRKVKIYRIFIWSAGTNVVTLLSASTDLSGPITFSASGELSLSGEVPVLCCALSEAFRITTSTTGQISGWVQYTTSQL